uniref:aminopeptidase P family N-terminal domain-containing protein n=1 Tax=Mesorhizobium TaxID=68287 RepID=UPI0015F2E181
MMRANLIPQPEFDARMNKVKQAIAQRAMDVGIVTSAENIFYLTGLDHQGYFGPHALAVRPDGETLLFARAHEQKTVARQVANSRFVGYPDTASPGAFIAEHLKSVGLGDGAIAIQAASLGFPPSFDAALRAGLPEVRWADMSGL